jgi:hypothetical protein
MTTSSKTWVCGCGETFQLGERCSICDRTGPVQCQWFLFCNNPATSTMRHPTLGNVPICDRCRARVEALS